MTKRSWLSVGIVQCVLASIVLTIWIYYSHSGRVSPILLPKPVAVARFLPELLRSPEFWLAIRLTAMEIGVAFLLAAVVGLIFGGLLGRWSFGARVASPLLVSGQMVPIILFYPICILFFGIGPMSKIVFAAAYGFFPIAATTILALSTVSARYLTAAAAFDATKRQTLTQVLIPAARPLLFSGLRLGGALCLIGVLAGEILGSTAGLGYEINSRAGAFKTTELYAYIVMTVLLVILFNFGISRLESRRRF